MADYDDETDMTEFLEFYARVEEIETRKAYVYAPPTRRTIRDRQNPMEVFGDVEFVCRYRFSKRAVLRLLEILPFQASADQRGNPLPPLLELLVALRFYGAGCFQIVAGDLVGISQPTVSRVIGRVSRMIAAVLFPAVVKLPSAAEAPAVMLQFYGIARFPGVTGCLDCTHVPIKSPGGENAEVFRNRKGYFSYNVQAITGPNLQFYDIVASFPGSAHDSRIFDSSSACQQYQSGSMSGLLLGDQGYACRTYLMTPLRDPGQAGSPEHRYNKSQIKTRNTVERAFGLWKRRFPCLAMTLQIKTETTPIVITACAALHNLGRLLNEPCPPAPQQPPADNHDQPSGQPQPADGFRARSRLIQEHFA